MAEQRIFDGFVGYRIFGSQKTRCWISENQAKVNIQPPMRIYGPTLQGIWILSSYLNCIVLKLIKSYYVYEITRTQIHKLCDVFRLQKISFICYLQFCLAIWIGRPTWVWWAHYLTVPPPCSARLFCEPSQPVHSRKYLRYHFV